LQKTNLIIRKNNKNNDTVYLFCFKNRPLSGASLLALKNRSV